MDIIQGLKTRVSIRAFKPDPVSKETVSKIMEAALNSPSWANTQPWEIYVATGAPLENIRRESMAAFKAGNPRATELAAPQVWPDALRKRTEELGSQRFAAMGIARDDKESRKAITAFGFELYKAPVVVYLCMDKTLTPWSIFDLGIISQSIMLAATEYKVDSMPAVSLVPYPAILRAELGIPENLMIVVGIALGYKDAGHPINQYKSTRRSLQETVTFKGF